MTTHPQILTQLAAGSTDVRGLIKFEFGAGTYGFARAMAPISYGGLTYQPYNLIEVSDIVFTPGTATQEFTVTLAFSGDDSEVSDQIKQIYALDYRDRAVTIMDAHFDISTGAFIDVKVMCKGYINKMSQTNDPEKGRILTAECYSKTLDYKRKNGRLATDKDQQRRSPGDKIFEHSSKTGIVRTHWGQETQ